MRIESEEGRLGVFIYRVYISNRELEEIRSRVFEYWRKEASVPGFRKGMVPEDIIYQKFGKEIRETYREFLRDKISHEVRKKHPFGVNTITIMLGEKKDKGKVMEIPGDDEHVFVVKVSTKTSVIPEDEEKLKKSIRSLKFLRYRLDENTVEVEELKKFLFSGKELITSTDEVTEDCVVGLSVLLDDEGLSFGDLGFAEVYLYLRSFPELVERVKRTEFFAPFELTLDEEFKKILENYFRDFDTEVKLGHSIVCKVFKILKLRDEREIIESNFERFSGVYGDSPEKTLVDLLKEEVEVYNRSRLLAISLNRLFQQSKVYIGEMDYIQEVISSIKRILLEYSFTYSHVAEYPLPVFSSRDVAIRNILESKAIEELYRIFFGKPFGDEKNVFDRLYERLMEFCTTEVKEITYEDLKRNLPYMFFDFVANAEVMVV